MKNALSSVTLAFAIGLAPLVAAAQSGDLHYNIAAGLTLPTGSYADRNDAGYNVIVGVGMTPRTSQLGFRAEGIYNEFNQKFGGGGKTHAGGVTGNLTYSLMMPSATQSNTLYLIGGVGYYSTREPAFEFTSESNIGWNVGGGFRFPLSGFSAYLEARFHAVSSDLETRFVPISFGLVF
jgi:Outer membrane protein beta-barrel domain